MALGPDDPRHGTVNAYRNHGCRCQRCKTANAAESKERRYSREGQLAPDDARHGRHTTYANWRCRCPKCKKAWADYNRNLKRSRKESA